MKTIAGRYGTVSTGTTIPDLAIDWDEKSIYNHAFVFTDESGGLVEATPHGVRRGHVSEYAKHPMLINCGDLMTGGQRSAVVQSALGYLDRPYGWDDILRIALVRFHIRFKWLDRRVASEPNLICSQLVALVGQQSGMDWLCGRERPEDVTPGMLAARPTMKPYPFT